jgi:hypothetical protein
MPYGIYTAKLAGAPDSGATTLERCGEYLISAKYPVTCSYTGKYFMPFNDRGILLGATDSSATTLERCNSYLGTMKGRLLCSYNGNDFQIYDAYRGIANPGRFSTLEQCGTRVP